MSAYVQELAQMGNTYIWAFSLLFFRVGAAMALMPAFGEQVVPARIKLAAAMAFAAILAPSILDTQKIEMAQSTWASSIGGEVIAGLIIGFLLRTMIFALQIAGSIAAQSTSLSQFFGAGLGADPQPAFSTLLVVAGLCLATMLDLHIRVIELFLLSFEVIPFAQLPNTASLSEWGIERVGYAFGLGFSLAAPFVIASVIYNLGLGAINKAMPQLMVAFIGAPAITLGALILLMVASPFMLIIWARAFEATSLTSQAVF